MINPPKSNHSTDQNQQQQQREEILNQLKRLKLYIIFIFPFLFFINSFFIVFAQPTVISDPIGTAQGQQDIVSSIFNNSLVQMLTSTAIITLAGFMIAKIRTLQKKLGMIEVLTNVQIKFKKQADEREKQFEERFIKTQEDFTKQINELCKKIDQNTAQTDAKINTLSEKITAVKDEATQALIQYLRETKR